MKTRERLARDVRLFLGTAAFGWLTFVACLFMARPPAWLMIGAFVATCGALLAMLFRLRCPHCRARLIQHGVVAAFAPTATPLLDRCPTCHARLD